MHIEIIRNLLYKAYIEDFYALCERLGGQTAETMLPILRVRLPASVGIRHRL